MDNRRLRAVLITADRSRAEALYARLVEEAGFEVLSILESRPGTQRWSALLAHSSSDCILLDATERPLALEILRQFQSISPHCPIIAFADAFSSHQKLQLLRAGAFELFDLNAPAPQLAEIRARLLRQVGAQPIPMRTSGSARVAAFTASKPGAGASTLARHAACALRRITGQRVLLMDLNPECVLPAEHRQQWNGITVDPPPAAPMPAALARTCLLRASSQFDWIILDLPCVPSDLTLALAPELADIVLTATPDLAGIHMAQRSLQLLADAGAPPANIRLALNRVTSHGPLTATDVEIAMKHKVEWTVPDDRYRLQSASEWGFTGNSPISRSMRAIATGLVKGMCPPPEPAQFFWMSRCEEVLA